MCGRGAALYLLWCLYFTACSKVLRMILIELQRRTCSSILHEVILYLILLLKNCTKQPLCDKEFSRKMVRNQASEHRLFVQHQPRERYALNLFHKPHFIRRLIRQKKSDCDAHPIIIFSLDLMQSFIPFRGSLLHACISSCCAGELLLLQFQSVHVFESKLKSHMIHI